MIIKEAIEIAARRLAGNLMRPRFEAELLMAHLLQIDRAKLIAQFDENFGDFGVYEELIERRKKGEPYAYIVGKTSFYDIEVTVTPDVLIPRPESELLVEKALEVIEKKHLTHIVEVGVGSGALSIVLAKKAPWITIVATDISKAALEVAHQNVKDFGLEDRIMLTHSDLIEAVDRPIEMVISNPPYIAGDTELMVDVVDFEPHTALFGGTRGDELLRRLIDEVSRRRIGYLACEIGHDQRASMQAALSDAGAKEVTFYKDYAGFDRGFVASFGGGA